MAEIMINNIKMQANEGEYILEVARKNGIFIPAICYLSKCSPTLACKLCMVEVDGKRSYACNTKVKSDMNIITHSEEIEKERKAIMQSYCVNHPLECGVCDKSGECELQDFTLLFNVDNQDFFVKDSAKKMDYWSQVKYDPNLCILCERCVTTCKDNLGEANLKVIKQDSIPQLDSAYWKEKMPKDAFSVWNRKQKGVIGFVGSNPCFDCVECVSVCPVGALGVKSFQYKSNAWELDKIDSTCNLCSSGCKIVYEGKKDTNNKTKIYRITNDFNFNPICGAGRFAYDIYAKDDSNNNIENAINAIKKASYINVGGNITNNEAKFLESLKKKFNIKLINEENRLYGEFLDNLEGISLAKLEDIPKNKVIISIAGSIKYENPLIRYKINNAIKMQKDSTFIYAHPIKDLLIDKLSKKYINLAYTPLYEDIALIAILSILDSNLLKELEFYKININYTYKKEVKSQIKEIIKDENDNEKEVLKDIINTEEITETREYYSIFEDANITYENYLNLQTMLNNTTPLIIIGSDMYANKNAKFIAKILASLVKNKRIKLILNPISANSNGIYNYLTLDSNNSLDGFSVGFRANGDYIFDSINANFTIPYFNAMNDSMVNIDNKILPIKGFLKDSNYLDTFCKELDLECNLEKIELNNNYENDGSDNRGIEIKPKIKSPIEQNANFIHNKENFNAYLRDINSHFYPYTQYSSNFQSKIGIYVSNSKMEELSSNLNIKSGDEISFKIKDDIFRTRIYVDLEMDGNFFAISPQISNIKELLDTEKYLNIRIEK
ncbi:NADH-quinone oxidoreductase subunit G [Helicobacter sp. MIT 14-3879]|uniref:NADH-quinone oxidoreductase subunit G n=1 Tax=Helicobacter sp. MIT 14-3879 TaxID=2040649 RepID=UPI000E1ED9B2|nr:NADH-quinone oxidoreductase subunit G [Helicobacter sp. MIT 14-3879]RDU63941.1 NADH-quinone oxidoreductase subunit G [Helicobacter sp. MIT 14-3879]